MDIALTGTPHRARHNERIYICNVRTLVAARLISSRGVMMSSATKVSVNTYTARNSRQPFVIIIQFESTEIVAVESAHVRPFGVLRRVLSYHQLIIGTRGKYVQLASWPRQFNVKLSTTRFPENDNSKWIKNYFLLLSPPPRRQYSGRIENCQTRRSQAQTWRNVRPIQ